MEAVGALGALLSTKKNQGDQARASLLASCKKKKKKEGMCIILRDAILCQRSLRPWEGAGVVMGKGGGQGGIGWKEQKAS